MARAQQGRRILRFHLGKERELGGKDGGVRDECIRGNERKRSESVPAQSRSKSSLASREGSVPPMLSEKCAWQ